MAGSGTGALSKKEVLPRINPISLKVLKAAEGGTIVEEDAVPLPWHNADHEHGIVRLEDAPPNTFLKLFPVARFRATLRR